MSGRAARRELLVGIVVVSGLVGFVGLLVLAGGGPSFLATKRTVDVFFKDGQGIRSGSPVRIAGIDSGQVVDVDLAEHDGSLRARVRIALPVRLFKKLKQDVKVAIQPSLTGQSRVNIVSAGESSVLLLAHQEVQGIESTFFDPILEQVGLGPVERSHLSHTIAEVRATVDGASPKIRQILAALQDTAAGVRESADSMRPAIESTAAQIESLAKKINESTPKIESTLAKLESITANGDKLIAENRENIHVTLASVKDLLATVQDITTKNRPRAEQLLINLDGTRARADRVLYQVDIISGQGVQILTKNRADIERTLSNVRDATDWADKLVQKIFANPFVLSPLYKPTPEDTRVQTVYDTAQVFTKGAQELNDLIKTLEAMKARAKTEDQQQEVVQLEQKILLVSERLNQTSQLLAEGLKKPVAIGRNRR